MTIEPLIEQHHGPSSNDREPDLATTAAAPGDAPGDESVVGRLEAGLVALGDRLLASLEEKESRDHFHQEQIDRLHAHLEHQRYALSERLARPYLASMIRLHDDLARVVAALRSLPEPERTADRCLDALAGFRDDVEIALSHHGVEAFAAEGERFDPQHQKASRLLATDAADDAGVVAERLLPGFRLGELVLQKERVAVYRHSLPTATMSSGDVDREENEE